MLPATALHNHQKTEILLSVPVLARSADDTTGSKWGLLTKLSFHEPYSYPSITPQTDDEETKAGDLKTFPGVSSKAGSPT